MTDSGYEPSNELIEAVAKRGWRGVWGKAPTSVKRNRKQNLAADLAAAVAYRTPDGHPELAPWAEWNEADDRAQGNAEAADLAEAAYQRLRAEVEALVTAARALDGASIAYVTTPGTRTGALLGDAVAALRAALVPFTEHQEHAAGELGALEGT